VSKIIPALQSRCTRFRFSPLTTAQITGRLDDIVAAERCVSPILDWFEFSFFVLVCVR